MRRFCLILALIAGCSQPTATKVTGPAAPTGWEVRYNAALALAHRGSDKLSDPAVQELFREMLDEDQQLRNFRIKRKDGSEAPDPVAARGTVLGAMKALKDAKEKRPAFELTPFKPELEKLQRSTTTNIARAAQALLNSIAS